MWYSLARRSMRLLVSLIGGYESVNDGELIEKNSCVMASNHISYLDPPFLGSITPGEIYYLAKSELFEIPLLGQLISKLNALPVKRGAIDRKSIEIVENVLLQNNTILIFPEGSRKNFNAKPGIGKIVYQTKKDVLPVYLENTDKFCQCLFRRKKIRLIVGNKIKFNEYKIDNLDKKEAYRYIANYVLKRINSLKNDN